MALKVYIDVLNSIGAYPLPTQGESTKKPHPRSLPPRFPGIVESARALGVSRDHLFKVLTGKRSSASLLERYRALQRAA